MSVPILTQRSRMGAILCAVLACAWVFSQVAPKGGFASEDLKKPLIEDEPGFTLIASRMAAEGDLNPHWFCHPGSTQIYPLAMVYWLLLKLDSTSRPAAEIINSNDFRYGLAARSVSYAFFACAVLAVFFIVWRTNGAVAAMLVTMFAMTTRLVMHYGPLLRNDGTSILTSALALAAAGWAGRATSNRRHAIAGLTLGLAVSTKFYLVFPAFAYLGALAERKRAHATNAEIVDMISYAAACAAAALVLTSPFLFIDLATAMKHAAFQINWVSPTFPPLSFWRQLQYFIGILGDLWRPGGIVLVMIGVGSYVREKSLVAIGAAAGFAFFMVMIATTPAYYARWILPTIPTLALFAGRGISVIWRTAREFVETLCAPLRGNREPRARGS